MAKKSRTKKSVKRKPSGMMKFLEAIVLVGAVAGVLIKLFKGDKKKKQ